MGEPFSCPRCGGDGSAVYAHQNTWRGPGGGPTLTLDICDLCWGSGNALAPFTNLRQLLGSKEITYTWKWRPMPQARLKHEERSGENEVVAWVQKELVDEADTSHVVHMTVRTRYSHLHVTRMFNGSLPAQQWCERTAKDHWAAMQKATDDADASI